MRKWFYVLELTDGRYYVGISGRVVGRLEDHHNGKGAVWTQLYPPTAVLFQYEHEVADVRAAELIESEITVRLMVEHGWRNVRGGYFCNTSEIETEKALPAHGHWDRVLQSSVKAEPVLLDWQHALARALELASAFHIGACAQEARDTLLAQLMALRHYCHWRADLEPGLDEAYWGPRGVLRVLLSLQANEAVGFKVRDAFAVLCAGMNMGRGGKQPWSHLFLAAWDAYSPSATEVQHQRVQKWIIDSGGRERDARYDEITSVLFPELRWRLRKTE
jgi:predicted GIY-YIG superfamily endonuclease